ncbi:phosphopentomutase [Olsenella sp. DSM 107455]|uniref:Phosphopentomutase n=1 Tax=Thermophilibacter gallinarum TaxID=2779357 RepID=A0ABR9QRZ0_9ACTN|nr:phosphopentomutase [Thermophilibacter gallinarum]MBE5023835.1 phosphopentomutase [Thermophilibacter gallinarum]
MRFERVLVIVADSIGVGGAPDAASFSSEGANTLGHVATYFSRSMPSALRIPTLCSLGVGLTRPEGLPDVPRPDAPLGAYGSMRVTSLGNDSLDGHWEMMCLPVRFHVDYFPEGFPDWLLEKIGEVSGRGILCNRPYSGTKVLVDYGERHLETGDLIVYTSGDSVLQIAAHEEVVPVPELYRICEVVRSLVNGPEVTMGRVIARPFVGSSRDSFVRTDNRRDFGLKPTGPTVLTKLSDAGFDVIAVGKTWDLFCGEGFTRAYHNRSNMDGMDHVDEVLSHSWRGLCFCNLVDFDSVYGHRRDVVGDGRALEALDRRLANVMRRLGERDLLVITADHGNDPTYRGTDHTRELVPLLVWSPSMRAGGVSLGARAAASDLGATILENFDLSPMGEGKSFLDLI